MAANSLLGNYPNNNFWRNKKVLITGHTGFKGSWLTLWLKILGSNVSGISLPPADNDNLFNSLELSKEINHIILDIRDRNQLKKNIYEIKPEFIFHLAAQPLVIESYKNPILTWETNVNGTINILESLRSLDNKCSAVFITTDKVYENKEWIYGYRENDKLGGYDPYSSSKAGAEIAINSWRSSFFNSKKNNINIASARAGNVIGGGDWSRDRIIPDLIRSLSNHNHLEVRNPNSTRPWQHVLEPLLGYLTLAEKMHNNKGICEAFNFGPNLDSNKSVKELVNESLKTWPGEWTDCSNNENLHEAKLLNLTIEKAANKLGWYPYWDFKETVFRTINWYKKFHTESVSARSCCLTDINDFTKRYIC